jgi:hypothetical protein
VRAPYTQELLDRAQAYVEQPLTARRGTEQGLAELAALYSLITGEAEGDCRQCQVSDFMAAVTVYIREATRFFHPELMADSKYTFASKYANEIIADGRYSKAVTAENMTDQDAEYLLKLGYAHVIQLKGTQKAASVDAETPVRGDELGNELGQGAQVEPSQREQELTAQFEQAELALKAEQDGHEATKQLLATEKTGYERVLADYNQANASRTQVQNSLDSEKRAHKTTKNQLSEVQKQLVEAQATIATLSAKPEATAPAPTTPAASTDGATA